MLLCFNQYDIETQTQRSNPDLYQSEVYGTVLSLIDCEDQDGNQLYCRLPQQEITRLSVFENIRFLPEPEFLCVDPHATPLDVEMYDTTPDEYDLGPIEYDADADTYHRWMIDSQSKNNSLMKRILRTITGGCFQSQTSAGEQANTPQPNRRSGKEPAESSAGGERLGRNKRDAGHSGSGDSD
ncbi:hypothetical protein F2Q70_00025698 [Brassica cretica]|uniref:Uncharacterized protein n=1 Tax=Brassica cretica TaxID=69181 RepID=A0A8S9LCD8_BRACR|nr:hypothetical protein F2Q70_00025698 [Brassica cretica]